MYATTTTPVRVRLGYRYRGQVSECDKVCKVLRAERISGLVNGILYCIGQGGEERIELGVHVGVTVCSASEWCSGDVGCVGYV